MWWWSKEVGRRQKYKGCSAARQPLLQQDWANEESTTHKAAPSALWYHWDTGGLPKLYPMKVNLPRIFICFQRDPNSPCTQRMVAVRPCESVHRFQVWGIQAIQAIRAIRAIQEIQAIRAISSEAKVKNGEGLPPHMYVEHKDEMPIDLEGHYLLRRIILMRILPSCTPSLTVWSDISKSEYVWITSFVPPH